jgi:hypothetical protein
MWNDVVEERSHIGPATLIVITIEVGVLDDIVQATTTGEDEKSKSH